MTRRDPSTAVTQASAGWPAWPVTSGRARGQGPGGRGAGRIRASLLIRRRIKLKKKNDSLRGAGTRIAYKRLNESNWGGVRGGGGGLPKTKLGRATSLS